MPVARRGAIHAWGSVGLVRVATFNILHGQRVLGPPPDSLVPTRATSDSAGAPGAAIGPDEVADPGALAAAIGELAPDVLGMQEVDAHQERSGGVDQSVVAAHAMGLDDSPGHRRFVPSLHGTPGHRDDFTHLDSGQQDKADAGLHPDDGPMYGVALVTRVPAVAWHRTTFPPAKVSLPLLVPARPRPRVMRVPDEPRAAVAAVLQSPGGLLTVATVHLSFVPGFNVWQLRKLREWLAPLPRPLVLMGDFNLPGALPGRITGWTQVVDLPTYPSFGPKVRFDHILLDGFSADVEDNVRASVKVHRLPVSDHCAVTAEIPV